MAAWPNLLSFVNVVRTSVAFMDRCGELTGSNSHASKQRAHEERTRLKFEVQRLITAMRDEEGDITSLYIIWRETDTCCG